MSEQIQHPEKILVLAGPTASGKSTITEALLKTFSNLHNFDSYTTRSRRTPDENDYAGYLTVEEFLELQRQWFFVEVSKRGDVFYWTWQPTHRNTLMQLDANWLESLYEIYKKTNTQIFTVLLNISSGIALQRACIRAIKQWKQFTPDFMFEIMSRVALDRDDMQRIMAWWYSDLQIDLNSEKLTLELENDFDAGKRLVIQTFNAWALNQITNFLNR